MSSTESSRHEEGGVIAVIDVTSEVLVDSVTAMSQSVVPPDLIQSTQDANEEESTKLTLAYERLYEIPRTIVERFADHIQYLDISHNKITNLDALVHFKQLTSLIADDNPITDACLLPPMPKLQLLWLNRCGVASLYPWLGALRDACPRLRLLSLMGNPAAPSHFTGGTFYDYLQYRLFVISQFPSLDHLDDRKVTDDQRAEARRLYRRPLLERLRPAPGGLALLGASVTWSAVQNKISALWGRDKAQGRNLLI